MALEATTGVPLNGESKLKILKGSPLEFTTDCIGDIDWKSPDLLINCFTKPTHIEQATKKQALRQSEEYSNLLQTLGHPRFA